MAFGVSQHELDDALTEADDREASGEELGPDGKRVDEHHLVEYVAECVKESFETTKSRREFDEELWRAHENEQRDYADKEAWQSKIITNRPFTTTVQASSIVRRGMIERPDYFSLEADDPEDPIQRVTRDFWTDSMKFWTSRDQVKFPQEFADASHFAFAIGQSQMMKMFWQPDPDGRYGLRLKRFESWKQYDDPEREPRKPQSGLYNIHEEWVDLYILQDLQDQGQYRNIENLETGTEPADNAAIWRHTIEEQREEERRKSGLAHTRNKFRKAILVREFWGSVLDHKGRMLYPNVSFTVAGNQIIRGPVETKFPRMLRWPWFDFCPLPHPIKYHGYGLYEGVLAIWKLQNNLLNLYLDNENFRINNMFEIDPSKLKYPGDVDIFPGKQFIRKANSQGPAVAAIPKGESNLADVQFIWAMAMNLWENGSFTTEFVKGEQGTRKDITATEVVQKMQQAMGVFDSIGRDVEDGAVTALKCIHEFLQTYWFELDRPYFQNLIQKNALAQQIDRGMFPDERMVAMALNQATFKIQGVSKAFEKAQIIQQLNQFAMSATNPIFLPFFKPYLWLKRMSEELNQPDLVLSPAQVKIKQDAQKNLQMHMALHDAKEHALEGAGLKTPNPETKKMTPPTQASRPAGLPSPSRTRAGGPQPMPGAGA